MVFFKNINGLKTTIASIQDHEVIKTQIEQSIMQKNRRKRREKSIYLFLKIDISVTKYIFSIS